MNPPVNDSIDEALSGEGEEPSGEEQQSSSSNNPV